MSAIAFFDVDNTLMKGYSGYYTTRILIQKGILKKRRLPLALYYNLISPFYKGNLVKMYEIAALDMVGIHIDDILKVGRECFEKFIRPRIYREGLEIVRRHREQGHPVYLMTSGPYMTIQILAEFLGADGRYSGGPVIDESGLLTKRIRLPICYREGKVLAAEDVLRRHGVSWEDCHYYGDSIDDVYLLKKVGHPHMVNPDKTLLKVGRKGGWPLLTFKDLLGREPSCRINTYTKIRR